jgi:hypothetical protein
MPPRPHEQKSSAPFGGDPVRSKPTTVTAAWAGSVLPDRWSLVRDGRAGDRRDWHEDVQADDVAGIGHE